MTREGYKRYRPNFRDDGIEVDGHLIMEKREQGFVEESIRQLYRRYQPQTVLELGYGYGYSAKEHRRLGADVTVVEPNRVIAQRARDDGFTVIEDFAQDITATHYDLVYDDRYDFFDSRYINAIPCKYYAPWCHFAENRREWAKTGLSGFEFNYNGETYFQPVIERV